MNESTPQRHAQQLVGGALLAFPLLIQLPYGMLIATYEYPAILRQPAEAILTKFAAGGPGLIAAWYLYGAAILPLLLALAALPGVVRARRPWLLEAVTRVGVASAVVQMIGLLRWVFAVPPLAAAFVQPGTTAEAKAAIIVSFNMQHQLFGVMLGEHLGQLLLAVWTIGIVLSLPIHTMLDRVRFGLGLLAGTLFLIGLGDGLATVAQLPVNVSAFPGIAFLIWSVWCCVLGWTVWRKVEAATH
jgi:hypothetical protein